MTPLVPIALIGWLPAVLLLFALLPASRAILIAFIAGWLFLPVAGYSLPGLPDYDKTTATTLGVLAAVAVFDSKVLIALRVRAVDLPIIAFCIGPFFSSISNDLGVYDGLSVAFGNSVVWGVPYFIGRLYFGNRRGIEALATAIFIGGLVYMPLCLFEVRMSPQLHTWVYGFSPQSWQEAVRWGGYRPIVFMQHGLAVGVWMAAASLAGVWLWGSGHKTHLGNAPMGLLVLALIVTTILCKSTGAVILLALGIAVFWAVRWTRSAIAVYCLLLIVPVYLSLRLTDMWSGAEVVNLLHAEVDEGRARSLQVRLDNEVILKNHALKRPIFGWGGWGRNHVYEYSEEKLKHTVTDGFWVVALGKQGLVGLLGLVGTLLLPAFLLSRRYPGGRWSSTAVAPAGAVATLLVVYMIDSLFNAMVNPFYFLMAGAMSSYVWRRNACVLQVHRPGERVAAAPSTRHVTALEREMDHRDSRSGSAITP